MLYPTLIRLKNRLHAARLRSGTARRARAAPHAPEGAAFTADCRLCRRAQQRHELVGFPPLTTAISDATRYRLARCTGCDAVYLDPLPNAVTLQALYSASNQFDTLDWTRDDAARRTLRSYERRLLHLGLVPRDGESLLEVGAGPAWIARVCKRREPGVRTVAQDVSAECATSCAWVDMYHVGTIDTLPQEPPFRLVSLTHVVEHLAEPEAMLAHLQGRIAPGGSVYITAPFRPPLWRPDEGFTPWLAYDYLHVPAHLSYLSATWLREACLRTGFTLAHWDESHDGHQVFEAVLRKCG